MNKLDTNFRWHLYWSGRVDVVVVGKEEED